MPKHSLTKHTASQATGDKHIYNNSVVINLISINTHFKHNNSESTQSSLYVIKQGMLAGLHSSTRVVNHHNLGCTHTHQQSYSPHPPAASDKASDDNMTSTRRGEQHHHTCATDWKDSSRSARAEIAHLVIIEWHTCHTSQSFIVEHETKTCHTYIYTTRSCLSLESHTCMTMTIPVYNLSRRARHN